MTGEAPRHPEHPTSPRAVSLREAARVWARIGLQSFGGPAGQIALMHRVLVEEKRWISQTRFLHALNYCMLLPGPEATQLATYAGWLMHRTLGGLIAGVLFILPGFLAILALSLLYASYQNAPVVEGLFFGIKPAVLAIIAQAAARIGGRVLTSRAMVAVAAGAFLAIFVFNIPFPLIILAAAGIGLIAHRAAPAIFQPPPSPHPTGTEPPDLLGDTIPEHARPSAARAVRTLATWGVLWAAPIVALLALLGPDHVFTQQSLFFSKAALVTFGGAYAVLAYIAQQAVEVYHWLEPGEMLDGLGMAETTPGPLIQVVQFVAFMGAHRDPGELHPLLAGTLASVLVTWVTFVPCFLWIFLGAPYMEAIRSSRKAAAALGTITAAVVGVIANLAVWFAIHTLFRDVRETTLGPVRVHTPVLSTLDPAALAIAAVATVLIFRVKLSLLKTIAVCAALGIAWRLIAAA
ncbi:MAG: chromate efflux transporter [Phycisphaerales bacterium]|nr:MAG: chromate efflux transporter [Phycisphaerales bacterium]